MQLPWAYLQLSCIINNPLVQYCNRVALNAGPVLKN